MVTYSSYKKLRLPNRSFSSAQKKKKKTEKTSSAARDARFRRPETVPRSTNLQAALFSPGQHPRILPASPESSGKLACPWGQAPREDVLQFTLAKLTTQSEDTTGKKKLAKLSSTQATVPVHREGKRHGQRPLGSRRLQS